MQFAGNLVPIVSLTYVPEMFKNFVTCYNRFNNNLKELYIVVNDHEHSKEEYLNTITDLDIRNQLNVILQSEVEEYAISKYKVDHYRDYAKSVPNQIKLLIPIYLLEKLDIHNMMWFDDDIIVNCNIQATIAPLMLEGLRKFKPVEKATVSPLFQTFWHHLSKIYDCKLAPDKFTQFISCCFWFNIDDDYPTNIAKYFNNEELYEYLKEYTFNFTYRSGMGDALNALEEFTFNYYCMLKSQSTPNYWLPPRFHTWVERDHYRDVKVMLGWPLIHAHFAPKTQWVKFYYPDNVDESIIELDTSPDKKNHTAPKIEFIKKDKEE